MLIHAPLTLPCISTRINYWPDHHSNHRVLLFPFWLRASRDRGSSNAVRKEVREDGPARQDGQRISADGCDSTYRRELHGGRTYLSRALRCVPRHRRRKPKLRRKGHVSASAAVDRSEARRDRRSTRRDLLESFKWNPHDRHAFVPPVAQRNPDVAGEPHAREPR